MEVERPNLLAAVRQAATTPGVPQEIVTQLAHGLYGFFVVRFHWQDWVQVNQTARGVARRLGDRAAQAQALNDLGSAYMLQGRYEQALGSHQESLALRREVGDRPGQAASLSNLGNVRVLQGHLEPALACQEESLAICRELGDRRGEAVGLTNLGTVYTRLGRYADALACHEESLAIRRELGDPYGEAECLRELGVTCGRSIGWRRHGGTGRRAWPSSSGYGPPTPARSAPCSSSSPAPTLGWSPAGDHGGLLERPDRVPPLLAEIHPVGTIWP